MSTPLSMAQLGLQLGFAAHAAYFAHLHGYAIESVRIDESGKPLLTVRPGPRSKPLTGFRVDGARMEARVWNCRLQWRLE